MSFQSWFFAAAGKRSPQPGWLCTACQTEFDQDAAKLKLIWTPKGSFTSYLNRSLSWNDWQRIAVGAPSAEEEQHLRDELAHLQQKKQQEQAHFQRTHHQQRAQLEDELAQLYKQSILDGFIPLRRMTAASGNRGNSTGTFVALPSSPLQFALNPGETLRWESAAHKLGLGGVLGGLLGALLGSGSADAHGLLSITTERILFVSHPQEVWERPVQQLRAVTLESIQGSVILVLEFQNSFNPILFQINPISWNVVADGEAREIVMTPQDLEVTLRALAQI